jgi:Zn finger protein HypA/HybF involved in hydrogenase expression
MRLFQKKKENFICEHCGNVVHGTGYTNHCPKCLYSKHVDVNPGDRAEICQGLMEPINTEMDHGEYIIIHKCQKCGGIRKNIVSVNDDFNQIIKLTR